jgi:hypothetical protein
MSRNVTGGAAGVNEESRSGRAVQRSMFKV